MSQKDNQRIDVDAAEMLVHWESVFGAEVASRARSIAAESSHPERVTAKHYRAAAQIAVRNLSAIILEGNAFGGDQKAA